MLAVIKAVEDTAAFWEGPTKQVEQAYRLLDLEEEDMRVLRTTAQEASNLVRRQRYHEAYDRLSSLRPWFGEEGSAVALEKRCALRSEAEEWVLSAEASQDVSDKESTSTRSTASTDGPSGGDRTPKVAIKSPSQPAIRTPLEKETDRPWVGRRAHAEHAAVGRVTGDSFLACRQQPRTPREEGSPAPCVAPWRLPRANSDPVVAAKQGWVAPSSRSPQAPRALNKAPALPTEQSTANCLNPRALPRADTAPSFPAGSLCSPGRGGTTSGAAVCTGRSGGEDAQSQQRRGNGGSRFGTAASNADKRLLRYKVGIKQDKEFQVMGRLIGPSGVNMRKIFEASGAKIRIRGKGSNYLEGPYQAESPDPLMICVSANCTESSDKAAVLVEELLDRVHGEYREFCKARGLLVPTDLAVRREVQRSWQRDA